MNRRLEALRAMAQQDVSPNERDIARAKLETMGASPPPRPPAAPATSPSPEPFYQGPGMSFRYTATSTAGFGNGPFDTGFIFVRITLT